MADFARSDDPDVQQQLDRLAALSPGGDVLGLDRIARLLSRLGNPEHALPPVFHVAGTNGKGSTCAFLRAALEAAGHDVHVYTSPHLVRFNERIRLGGTLIDDARSAALLGEVLDAAGDIAPSFFEATTAAAFLAFARTPADAAIVEVGLGGRLDATNVIEAPLVTGIAALGLDHQQFLGDDPVGIAGEKAGIAKRGVPLVTLRYDKPLRQRIERVAAEAEAKWLERGAAWDAQQGAAGINYRDGAGALDLPLPSLPGAHQASNAGLAVAMIRHQDRLVVPQAAFAAAMVRADWPARLQRLDEGPLTARLPADSLIWLDGGHNPTAAGAIAQFLATAITKERSLHIVCGLLANKDAVGVLKAFQTGDATYHFVPVEGHAHHAPDRLVAIAGRMGKTALPARSVAAALSQIADRVGDESGPPAVLIMGSLYLAGTVLAENGQSPA